MDSDFYREPRKFSKYEAWIDLLLRANHEENPGTVLIIKSELAKAWGWDRRKLNRFLDHLIKEGMCTLNGTTDGTPNGTSLVLGNWAFYQGNSTRNGTRNSTDNGTQNQVPSYTEKEEKNIMQQIPYQKVVELYHSLCPSFSKIKSISEERKKHIGARFKQYDGSFQDFYDLFSKAEASDFLKGKNNRHWKADFDWMMNETNMAKILEGKYDNREQTLFFDPPH